MHGQGVIQSLVGVFGEFLISCEKIVIVRSVGRRQGLHDDFLCLPARADVAHEIIRLPAVGAGFRELMVHDVVNCLFADRVELRTE